MPHIIQLPSKLHTMLTGGPHVHIHTKEVGSMNKVDSVVPQTVDWVDRVGHGVTYSDITGESAVLDGRDTIQIPSNHDTRN
jgi:hypothetical protein